MSLVALLLLGLICYIVYKYLYKPHLYWSERNVAHNRPWPIFGDMGKMVFRRETLSENIQRLYQDFPGSRYHGCFQFRTPILLVNDLYLIKKITVKDFDYFTDHKQFFSIEQESLFGRSLLSLKGEQWRDMRATLSPAFTSAKMKSMFVLISDAAEQFTQYFLKQNSETTITVSMKDVFIRYANDVIATTTFGLKCDSFEQKDNEFYLMGKLISTMSTWRVIKLFLIMSALKLFKILRLGLFPTQLNTFFRKIVRDTMTVREEKGIVRSDMLHLLMEAKKGRLKQDTATQNNQDTGFATVEESTIGTAKRELTDEDITAQAVLFFLAGFSTTSFLMCYMSYELAANPDIQKKLQDDIDETLISCKGKITYQVLLKMKYLDMVVSESLRKWPPGIQVERVAVKDYTIAPINPNEKPLTVETGTMVLISTFAMHRDPKYYPRPERFDPERFSDENKHKIKPETYMPFGSGPRNCIGSRFALLEIKAVFFHLLSKFKLVIVEKTKIPPELNFELDDFWLGLKARN